MSESHETQFVHVVAEFGCNGGHNDMYPPTTNP
jgi:hypothetical protein